MHLKDRNIYLLSMTLCCMTMKQVLLSIPLISGYDIIVITKIIAILEAHACLFIKNVTTY